MSENLDMIYGIHSVMEALKSKKRNVTQLYVSDNKAGHPAGGRNHPSGQTRQREN